MNGAGTRLTIIVLAPHPSSQTDSLQDLIKLKTYFAKRGEKYSIVYDDYGKVNKILERTCKSLLEKGLVKNPTLALYKINKAFMDSGKMGATMSVAAFASLENIITKCSDHLFGKKAE